MRLFGRWPRHPVRGGTSLNDTGRPLSSTNTRRNCSNCTSWNCTNSTNCSSTTRRRRRTSRTKCHRPLSPRRPTASATRPAPGLHTPTIRYRPARLRQTALRSTATGPDRHVRRRVSRTLPARCVRAARRAQPADRARSGARATRRARPPLGRRAGSRSAFQRRSGTRSRTPPCRCTAAARAARGSNRPQASRRPCRTRAARSRARPSGTHATRRAPRTSPAHASRRRPPAHTSRAARETRRSARCRTVAR